MIELRILGTPDVRDDSGGELRSVVAQPKRLALLAYLALASHRGFCRRDVLLGLFWPEAGTERARGALRQAVHHLRKALGPDVLVSRGDSDLGVDPARLRCDACEFSRLLDEGRPEEALCLYQGDLLPGLDVAGTDGLERWIDRERERLAERAERAALALATSAAREGRGPEAAEWARRTLALSPGNERALRCLMETLGRSGDRTGAVRAFRLFARWLRAELDMEPSTEIRALAEAIAEGRLLPG